MPSCLYGERMPRAHRAWVDGGVYHVFSRGSNRQAIFLNEGDYVEFDVLLGEAMRRFAMECFAWSLMPNHWHALVRGERISDLMKRVNHRYALRFNRRWGRTAHVFENRFGAVLQESDEQFLWTIRYIVRNPVGAGLAASVHDARWTSFRATAGLEKAPTHLAVGGVLSAFGSDDLETGRRRFIDFVAHDETGLDESTERWLPRAA